MFRDFFISIVFSIGVRCFNARIAMFFMMIDIVRKGVSLSKEITDLS